MRLTEEQEEKIISEWNSRKTNPPSLKELVFVIFQEDKDEDGEKTKAIRDFLAERAIEIDNKKNKFTLKEEHKTFIKNNYHASTCVDMAKLLFKNEKLTNLSRESQAISDYVKSLKIASPQILTKEEQIDSTDDLVVCGKYTPPKNITRAISRICRYVDKNRSLLPNDEKELTPYQKKCISNLISYLSTVRFVMEIEKLEKKGDRELFESSFIRYTWNKPDLTEEELDLFIILCTETVISFNILNQIKDYQKKADEQKDDETSRSISMALVEMIGGLRKEYNESIARQKALLADLTTKRSKKLEQKRDERKNLMQLIEYWKDEERRKRLIQAADVRKEELKGEVGRLESLSDIQAEIFGISLEEMLHG